MEPLLRHLRRLGGVANRLHQRRQAALEHERLRSLFDTLAASYPEPALFLRHDQVVTMATDAFAQLVAIPVAKLQGLPALDLAGLLSGIWPDLVRLLEGEVFRSTDGAPTLLHFRGRDYELALTPCRRDNQALLGHLLLFKDVSAWKRGQARLIREKQELEQNGARFRQAMLHSAMGVAILSLEGRFVQVNDALAAITGYSRERLESMSFEEITHPEDISVQQVLIQELIGEVRQNYVAEKRYVRADGGQVWVKVTESLVRDDAGRPVALIAQVEDITYRRQTEAALAVSERYRLLAQGSIDHAQEAMYWADEFGRLIYANHVAHRLAGMAPGQLKGCGLWEITDYLGSLHQWPQFLAQLQRKGSVTFEASLALGTGRGTPVEMRVDLIPVEGRTVILANLRDIAVRKAAEQEAQARGQVLEELVAVRTTELEEKNQALEAQVSEREAIEEVLRATVEYTRLVLDSVEDGIVLLDPVTWRIQDANRACESIFGCGVPELTGRLLEELIPGEAGFLDDLRELCRNHQSCAEYPHVRVADGSRRRLEFRARSISGTGGMQVLLMVRDITESYRMQEEMRKLALVAQCTNNILIITDAAGRMEWVNEGFVEHTGYRPEEVLGMTPGQLLQGPETDPEAVARIRHALQREQAVREEVLNYHKDGTPYWVDLQIQPVFNRSGRLEKFVALETNITAQKQARQLAQEAARRSLELARMKSDFLANMSHEIRTPLNAILGLSHVALRSELTAKQRDYLGKIHGAGTTLLAIVNDILDFSKIEAGKMVLEQAEFSIPELVASVLGMFSLRAREKGIELLGDVGADVPETVFGDSLRVGQVLTNLLGNAVKFTSRGHVLLEVRTIRGEAGPVLSFAVVDTGEGIPRDKQAGLFVAFEQVDTSTTRRYGGTGLGLSISLKLAELMGGGIRVESEHGLGSRFTFAIPLATARCWSMPEAATALAGQRALVVDRHPLARRLLAGLLQRLGLEVATADDDLAALEQARRGQAWHWVFVDARLAGNSGKEGFMAELTACVPGTSSRGVLLVAPGDDDIVTRLQERGALGVLPKPVGLPALLGLMSLGQETPPGTCLPCYPGGGGLAGKRVLLAEDNTVNQLVVQDLLAHHGVQVVTVDNGREALDCLEQAGGAQGGFDLVLMDVQMPELDGKAATRRIRANGRFVHLPIIALTAHAFADDLQACREAGMNDCITKPITPAEFYQVIERWISVVETSAPAVAVVPASAIAADPAADAIRIPGINVPELLARVNQKPRLMQRVLEEFVKWQEKMAPIHALIGNGEVREARFLAHSLKGMAGNVAATEVFRLAGQLDLALREGDSGAAATALALEDSLAAVCAEIHMHWGRSARPVDPPPGAAGARRPLPEQAGELRNLLDLCRAGDGDAVEVVGRVVGPLLGSELEGRARALEASVQAFDFLAAARQLEQLLSLQREEGV